MYSSSKHGWLSKAYHFVSDLRVSILLSNIHLVQLGSHIAHLLCRDKRKEFAPNCAAYKPFGLDVFLSQRKIDHIARFVELPVINSSGKLPSILVVNVQVLLLLHTSSTTLSQPYLLI